MQYRVYDHLRGCHYDIDAESVERAVALVQNDQWAAQLDTSTVTPAEHLNITPPDWRAHEAIAAAQQLKST